MNVIEKFQFAIAEGEPLDWAMLQMQLDAEHAKAESTRERENLLALFTVMADMVERIDTTADTSADFQEERQRSYQRLLLREACLGGRLCPKTLNDVTAREVMKGRMLQDDPMRLTAIAGLGRLQQAMGDEPHRQLAAVAIAPAGAWRRMAACMAALASRSAAMWSRAPENRTV